MAISYPVTPPAVPVPASVVLRPASTTGVSVSPFTAQHQVYKYAAQVWQMDVRLPPMKRAQAEAWIAFLLSLDGRYGTFQYGDPAGQVPRGTIPGAPAVSGGGQTGMVLNTDGWTPTQTGVLLAGDYLQFNNELHRVLADVDSNGAGWAAVDIWPAIRSSPTHGTSITVTGTKGLWRLLSDEQSWTVTNPFYDVRFSAVEAL